MKAEMPLAFGSASLRAMTTVVEATDAFVMNALLPFKIHSPCFSSARVRNAAASEPEPGSVRPHAPNARPVASAGRYFAFCSGDAKLAMWLVHSEVGAHTGVAAESLPRQGSPTLRA